MEYEILDTPLTFRLFGTKSAERVTDYGATGMALMNTMWATLRSTQTPNRGVNHWVYLSDGRMFVGVELADNATPPTGLERLDFELKRYLRHLHMGPYQNLPAKWQSLKDALARAGDTMSSPSLEIYGHHGADPEKLETTILIALEPWVDMRMT